MMKYLQKLGKSLMLPVSCLPVCGLLMGLGYLLCPAAIQGGAMEGFAAQFGYLLVRAGCALIDHIPLLFAVGVGIGMSEGSDGVGGLSALVSWLMITTLLSVDSVKVLLPDIAGDTEKTLAFSRIANPFIGILSGIIGSACFNRFHQVRLPDWLSFFSGKRCVAIFSGLASVAVSSLLLFLWPLFFSGLTAVGKGIAGLGAAGAGIYAFLNRLLIPVGLHHALNNVFWFDTVGLGDLSHFWAGETSADVTWSLGMYMSGFFPCMMFGVPGAALAMLRGAKPERRKAVYGILLSSAVCSFVCGITEPFEFAFMFLSPMLYAAYALLYGIVTYITVISGFRAGFSFSGGVTDLFFSASLPAAQRTWLILPLGLLAFVLFYGVFRFMIQKWNLKTPGREDSAEAVSISDSVLASPQASPQVSSQASPLPSGSPFGDMAAVILRGLGGAENIFSLDNCVTRLRLELRDPSLVDEAVIRSAGVPGVIHLGKNAVQVVIGTQVQFVAEEMRRLCAGEKPASSEVPASCEVTAREEAGVMISASEAPTRREVTAREEAGGMISTSEPPARRRVTRGDLLFHTLPDFREGRFEYALTAPTGIHARPAGTIAAIVRRYDCAVTIAAGDRICAADNVVALMALGAAEGTVLTVRGEGPEAEKALAALYQYLEENL